MQESQLHLSVLKEHFGHSNFRPKQWEIIHSLLEDVRDHCVVMATGHGKSLCYQYPPVFLKKTAFVISPLISLMLDQVLNLKLCNIEAVAMGTAQGISDLTTADVISGNVRLVYSSPEWALSDNGINLIKSLNSSQQLALVAIDEAHCVSKWGHDFRKAYRGLSELRNAAPGVPFLAVTATATPLVIEDICSSLKLRKPIIVKTSFDRCNLYLSVTDKGEDAARDIIPLIEKEQCRNNGVIPSTIVYCPTKKKANAVGELLLEKNVKCAIYHADIGLKERERIQRSFTRDHISIIVATVAFGMGIDKPDVRLVIHYGAPRDLESYYQEIGRAGRDGLPSTCQIFYSSGDLSISRFLIRSGGQFHQEVKHQENMLKRLERFMNTGQCRWACLTSYLDPDSPPPAPRPQCCDNCTRKPPGAEAEQGVGYEPQEDIIILLKAVQQFSGRYGLTTPILLLRGSSNKRLPLAYRSNSLYGAGSHQPETFWKCLGRLVIGEGLLDEVTSDFGRGWNKNQFPVSVVVVTDLGKMYIEKQGRGVVDIEVTPQLLKLVKPKETFTSDNWMSHQLQQNPSAVTVVNIDAAVEKKKSQEAELYRELYRVRGELAAECDVMPYMICSNRVLIEMSRKQPGCPSLLSQYDGFNEMKVTKFGEKFIECIKQHLKVTGKTTEPLDRTSKKFFKKVNVLSSEEKVPLVSVLPEERTKDEWAEDIDWSQVVDFCEDQVSVELPKISEPQAGSNIPEDRDNSDKWSPKLQLNLSSPPSFLNETQPVPELYQISPSLLSKKEDILTPILPTGPHFEGRQSPTLSDTQGSIEPHETETQWFSAVETQDSPSSMDATDSDVPAIVQHVTELQPVAKTLSPLEPCSQKRMIQYECDSDHENDFALQQKSDKTKLISKKRNKSKKLII